MMNKAIFAGTFDPIHLGHLELINRSLTLFNELVIGIGVNPAKKPLFSIEERLSLINKSLFDHCGRYYDQPSCITLKIFNGLLVDFAKENSASVLIRGVRNASDFEYEMNLANINTMLAPEIKTIFLPTRPELSNVSSSAIKEIAKYGADISNFVPKLVANEVYRVLKSTS